MTSCQLGRGLLSARRAARRPRHARADAWAVLRLLAGRGARIASPVAPGRTDLGAIRSSGTGRKHGHLSLCARLRAAGRGREHLSLARPRGCEIPPLLEESGERVGRKWMPGDDVSWNLEPPTMTPLATTEGGGAHRWPTSGVAECHRFDGAWC